MSNYVNFISPRSKETESSFGDFSSYFAPGREWNLLPEEIVTEVAGDYRQIGIYGRNENDQYSDLPVSDEKRYVVDSKIGDDGLAPDEIYLKVLDKDGGEERYAVSILNLPYQLKPDNIRKTNLSSSDSWLKFIEGSQNFALNFTQEAPIEESGSEKNENSDEFDALNHFVTRPGNAGYRPLQRLMKRREEMFQNEADKKDHGSYRNWFSKKHGNSVSRPQAELIEPEILETTVLPEEQAVSTESVADGDIDIRETLRQRFGGDKVPRTSTIQTGELTTLEAVKTEIDPDKEGNDYIRAMLRTGDKNYQSDDNGIVRRKDELNQSSQTRGFLDYVAKEAKSGVGQDSGLPPSRQPDSLLAPTGESNAKENSETKEEKSPLEAIAEIESEQDFDTMGTITDADGTKITIDNTVGLESQKTEAVDNSTSAETPNMSVVEDNQSLDNELTAKSEFPKNEIAEDISELEGSSKILKQVQDDTTSLEGDNKILKQAADLSNSLETTSSVQDDTELPPVDNSPKVLGSVDQERVAENASPEAADNVISKTKVKAEDTEKQQSSEGSIKTDGDKKSEPKISEEKLSANPQHMDFWSAFKAITGEMDDKTVTADKLFKVQALESDRAEAQKQAA